jgi:hypothetical protein
MAVRGGVGVRVIKVGMVEALCAGVSVASGEEVGAAVNEDSEAVARAVALPPPGFEGLALGLMVAVGVGVAMAGEGEEEAEGESLGEPLPEKKGKGEREAESVEMEVRVAARGVSEVQRLARGLEEAEGEAVEERLSRGEGVESRDTEGEGESRADLDAERVAAGEAVLARRRLAVGVAAEGVGVCRAVAVAVVQREGALEKEGSSTVAVGEEEVEGVAAAGVRVAKAEAREEGEGSAAEEALRLPPPSCPAGVALPHSVLEATALALGVALLPPSGPLVSEGKCGEKVGGAEILGAPAEGLALRLLVELEEGVGARGVGESVPTPGVAVE